MPLPERPRVVVVDDTPELLDLVCAVLQSQYAVELVGQAGDGSEALHVIAMLCPDLVIMDVHMPKMDGFAAASIISTLYPATTVVLMSGVEAPELRSRAKRCGARAFVFKPNLAVEFTAILGSHRRQLPNPPSA
ncbi:MAG: response regulator transcription factor [Actinomycetota bacterium]